MNNRQIILTLYIQEDHFLPVSVMVLSADNILSSILHLGSVDNKRVVISSVSLHEFDTLLELLVVMEPSQSWRGNSNDTACEFDTLAFVTERTLWFDDESGRSLSTV